MAAHNLTSLCYSRQNQPIIRLIIWFLAIFMATQLTACQQAWEPVGRYQSAIPEMGDRLWLKYTKNINRFTAGSTLELRADGTYRYRLCGTTSTGKWQRRGDMLVLYQATNEWTIDSLKIHGFEGRHPTVSSLPDSLYWNGSALENPELLMEGATIFKAIDWLEPVKQP